jgi:spermidine synthase
MSRGERMPGLIVLFVCFFVSGAVGLVYEVVWLRMLGLVFGHTVYAITTVLAAFMAGLALGSLLFGRRAARIRDLIRAYGWLEIGIGVSCALVPLLLGVASSVYLALHRTLGLSYNAFSVVQFLLIFALLLVPTTLMGGTMPILSQALAKREVRLGRMIGALYAVNTFGAVAGVALAGYVLLPAFGNRATTAMAVIGNLAVGLLAIAYSRLRPTGHRSSLDAGADPCDRKLHLCLHGDAGGFPGRDRRRQRAVRRLSAS